MYLVCYRVSVGDNYAGGVEDRLHVMEDLSNLHRVYAPIAWIWKIHSHTPFTPDEIAVAAEKAKDGRRAATLKQQRIAQLESELMELKRN